MTTLRRSLLALLLLSLPACGGEDVDEGGGGKLRRPPSSADAAPAGSEGCQILRRCCDGVSRENLKPICWDIVEGDDDATCRDHVGAFGCVD